MKLAEAQAIVGSAIDSPEAGTSAPMPLRTPLWPLLCMLARRTATITAARLTSAASATR